MWLDFQTLAALTDFTGFSWDVSNKLVTTTTLGWDQAQAIFILKGICLRTFRAARTNSTEVISPRNLKNVDSFVCKATWINWWPILKKEVKKKPAGKQRRNSSSLQRLTPSPPLSNSRSFVQDFCWEQPRGTQGMSWLWRALQTSVGTRF